MVAVEVKYLTQSQIAEQVYHDFGFKISRVAVGVILTEMGLSKDASPTLFAIQNDYVIPKYGTRTCKPRTVEYKTKHQFLWNYEKIAPVIQQRYGVREKYSMRFADVKNLLKNKNFYLIDK